MTNEKEGTARPGDYGYEAIGAHHEKTHAVEETVIVYVGHGPLAMLDAEGRICGATGSDGVNAFAMAMVGGAHFGNPVTPAPEPGSRFVAAAGKRDPGSSPG